MKFLLYVVVGLIFGSNLQAQKSKVLSAFNYERTYLQSEDCSQLARAVEAIEMALTDEKSAEWAKTWFYRGNIYFNVYISSNDECRGISEPALDIAYTSYMKAIELDVKNQFLKDIEPKIAVIANYFLQKGANNFNVKKYEEALVDFERAIVVASYFKKTDTTALYNAALVSEKLKNYGKASHYYEGLIDIGYEDPRIYHFLAEAYYQLGDSIKGFQSVKAGRIAYPSNEDLIIDELNYYLFNDESDLALKNIDKALTSMPDNSELYFAKGTLLDKVKDFSGAESAYLKSLEINPENFNSSYNLGALYFNRGVEFVEKANTYSESQNVEFKAAEAQAVENFDKALPYLEKANLLDPHDRATMKSLKNLYSRTGDDAGYKRITEILDN